LLKLATACNNCHVLFPAKRIIRRTLRRFGYDFRRVQHFGEPTLLDFLVSRKIDLILDVGANEGQFTQAIRNAGYGGEIVSFEPIGNVFAKLAANAARDRKWTARRLALGDQRGRSEISVTAHTVFSSFMAQSAMLQGWDPGTAVVAREEVEVATLDEIVGDFADRRVFLKIDTQGFERQVLAGARASLERILGVQLELPIVHLYKGVWSLPEAIRYMEERGFAVAQIHTVAHLNDDRVSLAEVDCVFRRADAVGLDSREAAACG
jgi:FkbM family methyltransferase